MFVENNVAGDVLVHLDHDDVSDIGIRKVGHRVLILKSIYQLRDGTGDDGYVPPSVQVDSSDYNKLFRSFEIRDERVSHVEGELKRLIDGFNKMREDMLPLFKIAKESKPLPTPEQASPGNPSPIHTHYLHSPSTPSEDRHLHNQASQSSLALSQASQASSHPLSIPMVRKLSKKVPTLAQTSKSPTTLEPPGSASSDKRPNLYLGNVKSLLSPSDASIATPVVTPGGSTTIQLNAVTSSHPYQATSAASSQTNFHTASTSSLPASSPNTATTQRDSRDRENRDPSSSREPEPFKSFRVTLDDPCYKVLPAALRRYKINGDWKQYALLVCYGDQERLLGLEEKPLIIFKELQDAGKQPVFMLRHIEGMKQSGVLVGTPGGVL